MPVLQYLPSTDRQTFVFERNEDVNAEKSMLWGLSNKVTYLDFDAPSLWLSMTRLTGLLPRMGAA